MNRDNYKPSLKRPGDGIHGKLPCMMCHTKQKHRLLLKKPVKPKMSVPLHIVSEVLEGKKEIGVFLLNNLSYEKDQ